MSVFQHILNEGKWDLIVEERVNDENLVKSKTEKETYETYEEFEYTQDSNSDSSSANTLDDLTKNIKWSSSSGNV